MIKDILQILHNVLIHSKFNIRITKRITFFSIFLVLQKPYKENKIENDEHTKACVIYPGKHDTANTKAFKQCMNMDLKNQP